MSAEAAKLMPDKEYFASLPRKRMGVGILFFYQNKLLILKPNYKPFWLLPGGVIDANESPLAVC